jgi:hypothetical protein
VDVDYSRFDHSRHRYGGHLAVPSMGTTTTATTGMSTEYKTENLSESIAIIFGLAKITYRALRDGYTVKVDLIPPYPPQHPLTDPRPPA